jgi:hypothetical protein
VYIIFAVLAFLSLAGFLFWSSWVYRIGYPLDDAWIHQTYARNFAQTGQWTFSPGNTSGGSTGPLWGFLLAFFHVIQLPELAGTAILGWFFLFLAGAYTVKLVFAFEPEPKINRILVGVIVFFEWHLVWSAGSGMETLLFGLMALIVVSRIKDSERKVWLTGFFAGISVWIRPGGLTLIAPVLFVLAFSNIDQKLKKIVQALIGFLIPVIPYFLFNYFVIGDFWPNTFFAKQAEYVELTNQPLLKRFWTVVYQLLVGVGVLLLPGFVRKVYLAVKDRDWYSIGAFCWVIGYISIYAFKLPVDYQHGRYVMPVLPIFLGFGIAGCAGWLAWNTDVVWRRIVGRVFWVSVGLISFAFWLRGANAFAYDVAVIETEMVSAAKWINENLDEEAIVAAHDIGALGYFGNREIVDMAGLISPDVIPIIRDEKALSAYLSKQEVDFLMTFPNWYQTLNTGRPVVYQTDGKFAPKFGSGNMTVYRWEIDNE